MLNTAVARPKLPMWQHHFCCACAPDSDATAQLSGAASVNTRLPTPEPSSVAASATPHVFSWPICMAPRQQPKRPRLCVTPDGEASHQAICLLQGHHIPVEESPAQEQTPAHALCGALAMGPGTALKCAQAQEPVLKYSVQAAEPLHQSQQLFACVSCETRPVPRCPSSPPVLAQMSGGSATSCRRKDVPRGRRVHLNGQRRRTVTSAWKFLKAAWPVLRMVRLLVDPTVLCRPCFARKKLLSIIAAALPRCEQAWDTHIM